MLAVMVLAGCAREGSPSTRVARKEEALRDLSTIAIGRGFDRALDVEREECFARDKTVTTPVKLWEGTGFTVFVADELDTKIRTAIQVGVKVQATEGMFGSTTAGRIGPSGERSNFVMLARYTARTEDAGPIQAAAPSVCAQVASRSQNGVEDFVSTCGDRYLAHKVYGGHVLLSWRRDTSRTAVDDLMGQMFGARTVGGTLDPLVNLDTLRGQGLGQEEVFIEAAGVPFGPTQVTLPNGQQGFTVEAAIEYLQQLAQTNVSSFSRVVDYSMAPHSVKDIDSCLAVTGQRSALSQSDWTCIYGDLTALADTRDGEGELAFLKDQYEVHRLALTTQLSRVVFNTVPQSRCAVDADGDPALEKSGPCQEQALRDFVKFFEACTVKSADVLSECRNPVLADVLSCSAFEAKDCTLPKMTLSNGTTVTCDEAGVLAALADVIPYQVLPPFTPAPPPGGFVQPLVIQFTSAQRGPIEGVSPTTDLCGITAVTGGLHGSTVSLENWETDWVMLITDGSTDPGKRVSAEVTCVKFKNFYHLNGGTHLLLPSHFTSNIPAANGGQPHEQYLLEPGNPMLGGFWGYLDEPSTMMQVTNADSTGFGKYVARDLFPFVSTSPILTSYSIQANAPRSGGDPGGTLMSPLVGESGRRAFVGIQRRPDTMSMPLSSNAFCYLTGLSGRYFNASDSARVSTSDGFSTLIVSTPLTKDRNPGAIVQCAQFDQP